MNGKAYISSYKRVFFEFIRNGYVVLLLIITFVALATCYAIYFNKKPLQLFPQNKCMRAGYFTDSLFEGKSSLSKFKATDSEVTIEFILKQGFIRPYAGIDMTTSDKKEIDISGYNELQFQASGYDLKNVIVYLIENKNSETEVYNKPFVYYAQDIELSRVKKLFKLSLNDFRIPDWWYEKNNISPLKQRTPTWKHFISINFTSGLSPAFNVKHSITINSIVFTRNNKWVIIYMLLIQLAVAVVLFLVYYYKHKPVRKSDVVVINYKAVVLNKMQVEKNNFLEYINQNFHDSELSLEKVSKNTGVTQRVITETISEKFNCNFKTYINQIRINEAKRLLKESDLQMSEVAYKVGFSSPSNFNRVFKILTGKNPSEFLQDVE